MKWTRPSLVAVAVLACTSVAVAATTQTVDDKKGDSKGSVDIKQVVVKQAGLNLSFTISAYKRFKTRKAPCVFVYAGRHNDPGEDGYAIGCFGEFVSAQGEPNEPLKRTRPDRKTVKYALDPAAIGSPGEFRWQAVVGDEDGTWDKAPRRPKSFDGSGEGGGEGDPNAPGGPDEDDGSGMNPDGTCGPDHVPCP